MSLSINIFPIYPTLAQNHGLNTQSIEVIGDNVNLRIKERSR